LRKLHVFAENCDHNIDPRYGKVVGMYLGTFPAVVIYDYEVAKDLFNKESITGRPDNFPYRFRMLGKRLGTVTGGQCYEFIIFLNGEKICDLG
jgi:hypothetical protein